MVMGFLTVVSVLSIAPSFIMFYWISKQGKNA
jgi:uncharacterized membrane protein